MAIQTSPHDLRLQRSCDFRGGFVLSLDITDKWANPWRGITPHASANDITLATHVVHVVGFNSDRDEFRFRNSWGPLWGDQGYGYISADRLAAVWWEAWEIIPPGFGTAPLSEISSGLRAGSWKQRDGSILHWMEVVDNKDDKLGWVSAVQRSQSFEIEELFVRPDSRRAGHGSTLFRRMEAKSLDCGSPISVWISFADRAPKNLIAINKVVGPSGLVLQTSGVRSAPLRAALRSNSTAAEGPSFQYPKRPPSVPSEVVRLASEIAIGLGTGVVSAFIYDALKSWINPDNEKRITARLGDIELSTSQVSVDEFKILLKKLVQAKEEADIRQKLLQSGIKITVEVPKQN